MAKLHFLLVLICLAQVCFSAPTLTTTKHDKPGTAVDKTANSDEMTMTPEQMADMKKQLMEDLPEEDAQIITDIFKQMAAESTQEDKTDGAVSVNCKVQRLHRIVKSNGNFPCDFSPDENDDARHGNDVKQIECRDAHHDSIDEAHDSKENELNSS